MGPLIAYLLTATSPSRDKDLESRCSDGEQSSSAFLLSYPLNGDSWALGMNYCISVKGILWILPISWRVRPTMNSRHPGLTRAVAWFPNDAAPCSWEHSWEQAALFCGSFKENTDENIFKIQKQKADTFKVHIFDPTMANSITWLS